MSSPELVPGLAGIPAAESSVSFIDGQAGVLEYRGYPIEELYAHSTYEEVALLLLYGELPTSEEAPERGEQKGSTGRGRPSWPAGKRVPFKMTDVYGGFAEVRGMCGIEGDELVLEYRKVILDMVNTSVSSLRVPLAEFGEARAKAGWSNVDAIDSSSIVRQEGSIKDVTNNITNGLGRRLEWIVIITGLCCCKRNASSLQYRR